MKELRGKKDIFNAKFVGEETLNNDHLRVKPRTAVTKNSRIAKTHRCPRDVM